MSTHPDDLPDEDDDDDQQDSRDIRRLRQQANRAKELESQVARLQREMAISKALGTDADAPWASMFAEAYKGELEAGSIRQAVADLGLGRPADQQQPAQQPQAQSTSTTSAADYQRLAALTNPGSVSTATAPPDLQDLLTQAQKIPNERERTERIMSLMEQAFPGSTAWSQQ